MKLKGLHLTLPASDLRPFLDPPSRLSFLSTLDVEPGKTYIRGFGLAKERKKLRLPWRQGETIFFDCSGTISLPNNLPDGAPVTHTVRRVYLDGRALVRFEMAIFTPPEHQYPYSRGRLDEFARTFWESEVQITQKGAKTSATFANARRRLVERFTEMTSPSGHVRFDLCRELEPQLQIIAEVLSDELPYGSRPIDSEGRIFLSLRALRMKGSSVPVDTAFLTYLPGYITQARGPEFMRLRTTRARIAWLHADLHILAHILQRCIREEIDPGVVSKYLIEVAKGLWDAPLLFDPEDEILFELMRMLEEFHDDRISRLLAGLRTSPLSNDVKETVAVLLERHVPRNGLVQSTEFRTRTLPAESSPTSLDERLRYALETYGKFLICDPGARGTRYGDEHFRESAERKAQGVLNRLKGVDLRRIVFVSIGGADGAELFKLLSLSGSGHGVLLEFEDRSTQTAVEEAKRQGVTLEVFTGDVMQKLETAMDKAVELRRTHQLSAIVVTAHAILHELFTRSVKGFDLLSYFAKLTEADIVIGREPIEPQNWREQVLISGQFNAELFKHLAEVIRGRHSRFQGPDCAPQVINAQTVKLHRALAIETLTKAFYSEDFLYELEECVSSFSPYNLSMALSTCLGPTHSCDDELLTSPSINRFWDQFGLIVKSSQGEHLMTKPWSHMWYKACKRTLPR